MTTADRDPAVPVLQPGTSALLDLAAVIRPDVDRRQLEGAILAAHEAGWTWSRTLKAAVQILADLEEPRDLVEATRDPLKRHRRYE